ncbi:hypothetical protein BJV82DRAFT_358957 [Fennellomyces sp. T-0311]|nr:hypothetical protein BJV82DRAFT_358957 [Fennellomyces sp. T-0311]
MMFTDLRCSEQRGIKVLSVQIIQKGAPSRWKIISLRRFGREVLCSEHNESALYSTLGFQTFRTSDSDLLATPCSFDIWGSDMLSARSRICFQSFACAVFLAVTAFPNCMASSFCKTYNLRLDSDIIIILDTHSCLKIVCFNLFSPVMYGSSRFVTWLQDLLHDSFKIFF